MVAGAGVAGALARDAQAQGTCQPLGLGCPNTATTPTTVFFGGATGPAFRVQAQSRFAAGLVGSSGPVPLDPNELELGTGVFGLSFEGVGVRGASIVDVGVLGTHGDVVRDPNEANLGAAVYGLSGDGAGVVGQSLLETGVFGVTGGSVGQAFDPNETDLGAGVYGLSGQPNSPGIVAEHTDGGVGLRVEGRTVLSTAGRERVPTGSNRRRVAHPAVRRDSAVIVTLNGDPGLGTLDHVEVANGSFTVVLGGLARRGAPFSYLVLN